jgi:hypothetical protein
MGVPVLIRYFVGFDRQETIAWHVLTASVIHRTRSPVAFIPIGNTTLARSIWQRDRGPKDSTEFSSARFMAPYLCGYQGWCIFGDPDMVCGDDIAALYAQRDDAFAVMCVKHNHRPKEHHKFLGREQTSYSRKNWSSLMLLNCAHPATKQLTPEYVNKADGLALHGMDWADGQIGSITGNWNVLSVGRLELEHPTYKKGEPISLLHLTRGGPWHGEFTAGQNVWLDELGQVIAGDNPCVASTVHVEHGDQAFNVQARYSKGGE